jgi:hypothetical protein
LNDVFTALPGFKRLYVIPECDMHPHRFNDNALVAAVWVAPWGIDALMNAQYVELDGSFTALQPFVYNVPQAIVNNNAIPVGFSMGPTESCKLFEIFHDALIAYGMPENRLRSLPVLSDEGRALMKYSDKYHSYHFYCFCHLIRKFGAGSASGLIARRALYCSTFAEFMTELPQLASDLRVQLAKGIISEESYKSLCAFIGFELAPDGSMTGKMTDFRHGLWERGPFGVSTCDNHAERFHGVLNKASDTRTALSVRLGILQREIRRRFDKYTTDPNGQAKKHFRQLQKTSANKPETCPYEFCGWSEIWTNRFRVPFPCQHVFVPPEATVEFPQLPPLTLSDDVPVDIQLGDRKMEKWLRKILPRPSPESDAGIQWTVSNENPEEFPLNSDWVGFIRQVVTELKILGVTLHRDELLIKVTTEYLTKCREWREDPDKCSIEAKSEFRALLLGQLVE